MNETAWAEFASRFPWAIGLSGEELDEAIAAHWPEMDDSDIQHMFKRLALFCEFHSVPRWPNQ